MLDLLDAELTVFLMINSEGGEINGMFRVFI